MSYTSAEILEHSVSEYGAEAITMKLRFPRIILAELNTHRVISKNTSSSRAIPIIKMIKHAISNMFIPTAWGSNIAGMQAGEPLTGLRKKLARLLWKSMGITACGAALVLNKIGVHKQITNRLIENFTYVNVIITTTDLTNFFNLRHHKDAQPEIFELAQKMLAVYGTSEPKILKEGEWHLPLVTAEERQRLSLSQCLILSVARCASTSYMTVDGEPLNMERARKIYDKLTGGVLHASPFEHQLTPDTKTNIDYRVSGSKKKYSTARIWTKPWMHGNTYGWIQNRKIIEGVGPRSIDIVVA